MKGKWTVIDSFQTDPRILLDPQIPKPMHGVNPRTILGADWWDTVRKDAYRSTNYRCLACGVKQKEAKERQVLEAHELYDTDYRIGRMVYVKTVPLCHYCHNFIHVGRLEVLVANGKEPPKKFKEVLKHGNHVLRSALLQKPKSYTGPCAWWGDWRLVLFGELYPPKYPTEKAWREAYWGKESLE